MERELVGLLGAGLTSMALGFGVVVPVGAIDAGYTLIDVISRESGPRIGAAINGMVQTLWLDWQQSGLDRATLAAHAGALPAVIELNRPPTDAFVSARQNDDGSRMLAVLLIERARHSGDILRAGLDEGIVYTLLERLYAAILAARDQLGELMAAVDLYLQTDLWRQAAADEADMRAGPAQLQAKPPQPVVQLAIGAIRAVRAALGGPEGGDKEADVERRCAALIVQIESLTALAQRAPEIAEPVIEATRLLTAGEFAAADRTLSAAEQTATHRATSNLASARDMMHLARQLLEHRAALAELLGDYRKAARHLQIATRCLTSADGTTIWSLRLRQADVLLRLDAGHADDAVLADAVQVLTDAVALDPDVVGRAAWAEAQLRLSALLVELGRRRGGTRDFELAVYHAEAGWRTCLAAGDAPAIARARLMLGRTQWLAGDRTGNGVLIEHAAASLHESLPNVPRESDPALWVEVASTLGQALLRLSTLNGDPKLLSSAIANLRAAVQFAATCNVPIDALASETALGRALLGQFASGAEPLVLDLAATAFRRALKAATLARDLVACAGLRHELGMTLWAVAERAGNANAFASAVETLEASIATYDSIDDAPKAAAVRRDLDTLKASLGGATTAATGLQHFGA